MTGKEPAKVNRAWGIEDRGLRIESYRRERKRERERERAHRQRET